MRFMCKYWFYGLQSYITSTCKMKIKGLIRVFTSSDVFLSPLEPPIRSSTPLPSPDASFSSFPDFEYPESVSGNSATAEVNRCQRSRRWLKMITSDEVAFYLRRGIFKRSEEFQNWNWRITENFFEMYEKILVFLLLLFLFSSLKQILPRMIASGVATCYIFYMLATTISKQ